jgi:8-oxo-dGTP diphosphatase
MPASDQNVNPARYQIVPRTLVFVTRNDEILLLKLLPRQGTVWGWAGKYNGIGGHIERGEDPLTAAHRELLEETGLTADLSLSGTLIVDTGQDVGIGLFIFHGENPTGESIASREGLPEWIPLSRLADYPLVDDVAILLERILHMQRGDPPFSARSFYDKDGKLIVAFADSVPFGE